MSSSDDDGERTTARPRPHGDHLDRAFRRSFNANGDVHPDKSRGQRAEAPPGEQAGRVPEAQGGSRRRRRRPSLMAALAIGEAAALLVMVIVILRPFSQASLTTVRLVGHDVLFDDPGVQQALRQEGIVVQQSLPDSRVACTHTSTIADYDISDTSAEAASCYEKLLLKAGKTYGVDTPYLGPVVIITYKPVVAMLEKLHIAYEANGITVFNVAAYLNAYGERRTGLPLLWTANPNESNLGAMLGDIAYAAQTGGDQPSSIGPDDPRLPPIRNLFTGLGELPNHSTLLLKEFLASGMADHPMATVYESQYLSSVLTGVASSPSLTVMYPTPDVVTSDELVAWTPTGKKLIEALKSKPLAALLEAEGYRTDGDAAGFVTDMASKGINVLDLSDPGKNPVQSVNPLNGKILNELINAVAANLPA